MKREEFKGLLGGLWLQERGLLAWQTIYDVLLAEFDSLKAENERLLKENKEFADQIVQGMARHDFSLLDEAES